MQFEHAANYLPAILSYAVSLPSTSWTHITVVYNNNRPSLYINGFIPGRCDKDIGNMPRFQAFWFIKDCKAYATHTLSRDTWARDRMGPHGSAGLFARSCNFFFF